MEQKVSSSAATLEYSMKAVFIMGVLLPHLA